MAAVPPATAAAVMKRRREAALSSVLVTVSFIMRVLASSGAAGLGEPGSTGWVRLERTSWDRVPSRLIECRL
jgi:hypothetical protein